MDGLARSALYYLNQTSEYFIPLVWSSWVEEPSPGAVDRFEDFYEFTLYPTAVFGGTQYFEAWDCSTLNYEQAYYNQIDLPSPLEIELQFEHNRTDSFTITANVEVTGNITAVSNKIFFVITNWVEYSTSNPWYYLVVAKSPEEDFTLTSLGETGTYTADLSFEMQADWFLEDLHAVALVQNWDNKAILQAAQLKSGFTSVENPVISNDVSLRNYPNPFNPATTISFQLSAENSGKTDLSIYNTKGQKIKQLVSGQLDEGQHSVVWNGENEAGETVSSGIYYYRLLVEANEGGRFTSVKKLILLK